MRDKIFRSMLASYAPGGTFPFVGMTFKTRYDDLFVGKCVRIQTIKRRKRYHLMGKLVCIIDCEWMAKARLTWDSAHSDPIIYASTNFRRTRLEYSVTEGKITPGGFIVHTGAEEVTILPRTQLVLGELIRIEKWATENHHLG